MDKRNIIRFFDRLAPQWDDNLSVNEDKMEVILDAAHVKAGSMVLDVACGTGVMFPFYLKRDVMAVTGIDISAGMVTVARSKFSDPRINVICADMEELHGGSGYECCVIYNAFPHFADPERLICNLATWLKPGGRLTIAHDMSLEKLNLHHRSVSPGVSRAMLPPQELASLLSPWYDIDIAFSDEEKYIVSGSLARQIKKKVK